MVTTQPLDRTVAEGDASNTAVFTVALATQPSHDVTVTVTTPAGLELDGPDSPTAFTGSELLTFTASTWNSPQTVTVRAVEDSTDSPRSLSVQYSSTSVSDSDYSSLTGTAATITVIDNDPTYVRVSAHFRDIAEGETKDITVVLRRGLVRGEALSVPLMFIDFGEKVAIYNTDFTLTCPSGLPTGVTCSGFETTVPTVTFTGPGSGATATSFTLTLTATRDNVDDDGEDVFLFDPAPRTTGLDGGLIVVPDVPVFSITDSAPTSPGATAPRVTIDGVPGKINGTAPFTATFTFSQAVTGFTTDDVTVAGGAKGTFSAASATRYTLVVTPAGGSDAVVTVRAGAATGSGRTGPASAVSARATWDATPPTLSITGVPAAIGSTASFTATFTFSEAVTGFNTDDVTVDGGSAGAVSGSGDEYTATITPEGSADVTVTVRADAATDGANAGPASAESATAVWDDSQPAAVIVSGSPVSLVEGGDAGSYTVALATDPGGVVTVTPSSSDPGAVAVSGALTLTSTNWNEPQTVTVSAVDDGDRADESVVVTHAVVGYPGVSSAPDVAVTVADDDEDEDEDDAAVGNPALVASADSLVLTEGGEGSYTLVLVERPTNEVTVSITAVGGAALDVSPPSLTFGVGDWDRPQSVTVAALEDDDGADESGSLTHSATGGGYEGVGAEVAVTVTDNDEASLAVSETSLSLDEGGSASYTVALATRPPSAVTVEIAVSGGAGVELSASSLTFTPSNWSEAQTVTVSANEDDDAADGAGTLRHAATGGGYEGVGAEVAVTVTDNDEASLAVSETSLSLDEGGSASYEVALATRPPSAVTVEIAASGGAGVGLSASSLTFTPSNWSEAQAVTVSANEDDDAADGAGTLRHAATGGGYEGVGAEVAVTVTDNDEASLAVSETSLSLDEGGSASYTVALATRPPSAVTVEIAVSGGAGVGLSASSLTFGADDWDAPQSVTVTALEDDDGADESGSLTHSATGGGYEGVSAEVAVSVSDDDEPSLAVSETSLSLDEGGSASYEVALATRPPSAVTVEIAASGGAGVGLSASSLTFTPSSWSEAQTVTVSANEDDDAADGAGTLRHAATGGGYEGVGAEVAVTVTDNDEPSLNVSAGSLSLEEGGSASYEVALATRPPSAVTVEIAASGGAGVGLSASSLTFTPS
ncbi:MAG: Ig-like domain-containing protein, partial [Gammaproteobacteria bacterium]|nr:Ig-like domain-containing protein [Gammaproteobacteria bacterium]